MTILAISFSSFFQIEMYTWHTRYFYQAHGLYEMTTPGCSSSIWSCEPHATIFPKCGPHLSNLGNIRCIISQSLPEVAHIQMISGCLSLYYLLSVLMTFCVLICYVSTFSLLSDTAAFSQVWVRHPTLHYQQFLNYSIPTRPVSQGTITISNYGLKGLSH